MFVEALENRRFLAAAYYVSATGNDALDGRSPATAWKSIARVNGKNWNAGDKVLFEGGKTFGVSGSNGANLLTNGGFELGLSAWSAAVGGSAASAPAPAPMGTYHSGASAVRLGSSADAVRQQDLTGKISPNQTYKMSAWTRSTSAGLGDRRVGITFKLAGQEVATYYRGFRSSTWAQTQWEFVAPRTFDQVYAWVSKTGDNSTFYVDDLSLNSISNGVVLDETDAGTSVHPLVIGSYGTGRATLNARDGVGIWAGNAAGIVIDNLNFIGSWNAFTGAGANAGVGIELVNTLASDAKLNFVRICNVNVSGFRWAGIRVGGWRGKSGFRDVRITDSVVSANGDAGIMIRGEFNRNSLTYANENVQICRVKATDNNGIPDKGGNSGSGIQLTDTLIGKIERCVATQNGDLNNFTEGGPVGIWAFDASRITIQCNESYNNKTGSGRDGAGFDLDGGVTNSIVQFNYAHDNDGPGFLLCQFGGARAWGKNIVRYNISQNDARRNSYGAVTLSGPVANAVVEHNTLYTTPAIGGGVASGVRVSGVGAGTIVRNNIIQSAGGTLLVDIDSQSSPAQLVGNVYWSSGSTFRLEWGTKVYTSLSSWIGSTAGRTVDPKLVYPGHGPTLGDPKQLFTLTHYALRSDSTLINSAAVLSAPYAGYVSSRTDFFGKILGTARDVGAAEFA